LSNLPAGETERRDDRKRTPAGGGPVPASAKSREGERAEGMRRFLDGLYDAAGVLAGVFLVIILLLMMSLSLGRQVGMNVPAGDDLVSWSMAALAFLGLAHTFRKGEIIRMGLLVENLGGRPRVILETVALLIGSITVGYFAWHATQMTYHSWKFNDLANGVLPVPLWIPQLSYAIGLIILAIAMLDELLHVIRGGFPRYAKPPPKTAEEVLDRAASGSL
jgi:TRAP-type C4-dicarboxylate transport system permease small subunit